MTSVVEISNRALSYLGNKRINQIDADTNEARACNLHFAPCRDDLLERHEFHFGVARAALAALATNPRPKEWKYAYGRPSFSYTILSVFDVDTGPTDPPSPYLMEGSVIYSNIKNANIAYSGASEDPGLWSATFRTALAWELASAIAMSLTEDTQRARAASDMARSKFTTAVSHDLRTRAAVQSYTRMSPAIIARLGLTSPGAFYKYENAV